MIDHRSASVAVAASIFALFAQPAGAENYNPYVTIDYLESATPKKNGDPDRPMVIGNVPNAAKPKGEDKVWDWHKSQELGDLPAPPPGVAQPTRPAPPVNGGLTKFGANIGDQLKHAPGADVKPHAGPGPASPRGTFHGTGRNLMSSPR